ncbi:MAG: aminopeptidase [Bacteroidaceae bacterium]|nr:aminopeptidase [Bacteroidaceae bacterium]
MKKTLLAVLALVCVSGSAWAQAPRNKDNVQREWTVIREAPITSVKNQNRSGTCWDYSSLSYFESELLRLGKGEYDLCESFVAYHTYMDRAQKRVRTHGDVSFAEGGSFYDVLYCLKHYGICPQEAMPFPGSLYGDSLFNFTAMWPQAEAIVDAIAKTKAKTIPVQWKDNLSSVFAGYFGQLPTTFDYQGKAYTPKSFAASLGLNWDDYVSLTSYTHEPFYSKFALEIPDNWRWGLSYNLPLDEFMEVMDYAVRQGYAFAWGADVSEKYFNYNGACVVPQDTRDRSTTGSDAERWSGVATTVVQPIEADGEKTITQEMRQLAYDNWETTDDHGMVIYGLAKDQDGKEFFMVKNSWGEYEPYGGKFFASKGFVAYKTMNILINKNAIPKAIRKKLGI